MPSQPHRAVPGGPVRSRPRLLVSALAAAGAIGLSACEDRSVTAGVDAATQDAQNRVDEAAAKVGDAIDNAAGRAQDLAAGAADDTKSALSTVAPKAERLADKAGDRLGDLADATGDAAIKAGDKVASAGRDAKRRAAEREPAGDRAD